MPNIVTTSSGSQEETKSQTKTSWEKIGAGATFTKTYNLSGSTSVDQHGNTGRIVSNISLSCGLSIHATPYNWRHTNPTPPQVNGELVFIYDYDSTTGSKFDLNDCYGYEVVRYFGGNPYIPPAPFVHPGTSNPTKLPSNGGQMSIPSLTFNDRHHVIPVSTPYSTASYTASQRYLYDDQFTNEVGILIPSTTGENTSQIVRKVGIRVPYVGWWYSCEKSGYTAWLELQ